MIKKYVMSFALFFPLGMNAATVHELLQKGSLVFDVGAHVGKKTKEYLKRGYKVVCFEPSPKNADILKKTFKDNANVFIEQTALGHYTGVITFNICSSSDTISTCSEKWKHGRFSNYSWDTQMQVPIATLDQMIQKYGTPDFCKIDVEGFEHYVLSGLSRSIKSLSFEFAKEFAQEDAKACLDHLKQLGFTAFNIACGESETFMFDAHTDAQTILDYIKSSKDPLLWGDIYAFS